MTDNRSFVRIGRFYRKSDRTWIRRYRCRNCSRTFSRATFHPCIRQKKRHLNQNVRALFCSGVSLNRIAKLLNIHRITVARKLVYLAKHAELRLEKLNQEKNPADIVEFDDLETFEHSKCKPLSVPVMVTYPDRRIIGFEVAAMPAKGLLAKIAVKKYGKRKDERPQARRLLFERVEPFIAKSALIKSDQNPHYPPDIEKYFPQAQHLKFKGRRGCVTGQGELKSSQFDPIFRINHTLAMLRANINRLFRRTWCTTKRHDRLRAHIMIYVDYHNTLLIK